jgi:hypothetical protein
MAIAANVSIGGEPVSVAVAGPMVRIDKKEKEFVALLKEITVEFEQLETSE